MPSACKMTELPLKCRASPLRITVLACELPSQALGTLWFSPGPEQVFEHQTGQCRQGLELWLGDTVAAWISLLITLTGG